MAVTTTDIKQKEIWHQLEKEQKLADENLSDFSDAITIIHLKVQLRLLSSAPESLHEEIRKKLKQLISQYCNDTHPLTTLLLLHACS